MEVAEIRGASPCHPARGRGAAWGTTVDWGHFSQLHVRQGRLVVQQVDPHFMPVSGHVRCGDEVVSVDGTPVQAATMAQCIRLLRTAGRHTLAVTTGAGAGAGGGGGGGGGGGR